MIERRRLSVSDVDRILGDVQIVSGQQWVNNVFGRWATFLNCKCLKCKYFRFNPKFKDYDCEITDCLLWRKDKFCDYNLIWIIRKDCEDYQCSDEAMDWAWAQLAEVMDRNDRLQKEQQ